MSGTQFHGYVLTATHASTERAFVISGEFSAARVIDVVSPSNRRPSPVTPSRCFKRPVILSSTPRTESRATDPSFSSKDHRATKPSDCAAEYGENNRPARIAK